MDKERLHEVSDALQGAWSAETSANPNWSMENPALGQCAVTACVVEDYLGGDILNTTATLPDGSTDSHYYNIVDGEEVDLTRQQFPEGTQFSEGQSKTKGYDSTKEYCLSFEPTQIRYSLLKQRLQEILGT